MVIFCENSFDDSPFIGYLLRNDLSTSGVWECMAYGDTTPRVERRVT